MKKLPMMPLAVSRSPLFVAMTALVLGGAPASAAPTAPGTGGTATTAKENYCVMVKNGNAHMLCLASRAQFYEGDLRAALATMKKAQTVSPQEGIIPALAARIMLRMDDPSSAEAALRKAMVFGAPHHIVLPVLFRALMDQRKQTMLLMEFPDPATSGAQKDDAADILHGRAMALSSLHRIDEAAAALDRALVLRRDVPNLIDRATLATQQNNPKLAAALIDEAYKIDPRDRSAFLAKLFQVQRTEAPQKTLAFSAQLIQSFPKDVQPRRVRIEAFLKLNQQANAQAEVNSLLAQVPGSYFGSYYKALLLGRTQKKEAWRTMQAIPPDFMRAYPSLALPAAQLAIDAGYPDAGGALLSNAVATAPDLIDTRLRLVELKLSQDNPQAAMTFLTPVKDAHDPRVRKLLGQAQAQLSKKRSP